MAEPVRYYQRQFGLLKVNVHLGSEVDVEMVEAEGGDVSRNVVQRWRLCGGRRAHGPDC